MQFIFWILTFLLISSLLLGHHIHSPDNRLPDNRFVAADTVKFLDSHLFADQFIAAGTSTLLIIDFQTIALLLLIQSNFWILTFLMISLLLLGHQLS
jgi:hypothetical protein